MPGLPMFGHGQIEGFSEKYGMEYRRACMDEQPDQELVERHEQEIFPLIKASASFLRNPRTLPLFDFIGPNGESIRMSLHIPTAPATMSPWYSTTTALNPQPETSGYPFPTGIKTETAKFANAV